MGGAAASSCTPVKFYCPRPCEGAARLGRAPLSAADATSQEHWRRLRLLVLPAALRRVGGADPLTLIVAL